MWIVCVFYSSANYRIFPCHLLQQLTSPTTGSFHRQGTEYTVVTFLWLLGGKPPSVLYHLSNCLFQHQSNTCCVGDRIMVPDGEEASGWVTVKSIVKSTQIIKLARQ